MADQCIVCLEELDVVPDAIHDDLRGAGEMVAATIPEILTTHPGKTDNQQAIALIKPCGHILHDECLREWSQKANSCPICRHSFNLVEVLDKVGGTVVSEYEVEDKKQVAEFDPNAWIEENLEEEESTPCPICDASDQEDVLLLCDGCDAPYHTHCVGLDRVPRGRWFCMECVSDGIGSSAPEPMQAPRWGQRSAAQIPCRTQASVRRTRQRMRTDHWYGAWSIFSNRVHDVVGLDLDFSDDDQSMASYRNVQRRTAQEAMQFQHWQQRLQIAGRQGAREVFRNAAPPMLRDRTPQTPVETPEETQAWGALEKAKELDTSSPKNRKRKSRSATASPVERSEAPKEPERKLKRPRTRRVLDAPGPSSTSASSMSHTSRQANGFHRSGSPLSRTFTDTNGEPSFLSSLLREVEAATSDDDTSRSAFGTNLSIPNRVTSPSIEHSSPATSPSPSSSYHTPRAMSITPPPHITKRPGSPLPLTSRVEPMFPPAEYPLNRSSPEITQNADQDHSSSPTTELRQPRPRRQSPIKLARSPETSPIRATMSIEAKEGINKIVKSALAPHWKAAQITKEQYADINRDVSRKMYEIVANGDISDERDRCAWEKMATTEVASAVKSLTA